MASRAGCVLYVGTVNGLYQAEPEGDSYKARLLGLQGKGAIRSPVVIDCMNPQRLYVGTGLAGMYRSEDGGQTWEEINEGIVYKGVYSLVQHPRTGELYAGTGPSSVFKSTDGGDSWSDCAQLRTLPETKDWTFPSPPHISHVRDLALWRDDPNLVLGAVEDGWVIRSKDGGKTWQNIKEGICIDVHGIAYMPDNPDVVVATANPGVYRSLDGGNHFEESNSRLDRRCSMVQLVVHPRRPKVLFTAGAAVRPRFWGRPEGADSAFYRSEDQGMTWRRLSGGLPEHLKAGPYAAAGDPEDPDVFLVGMSDGTVWMTEDSGESFRQILGDLPPGWLSISV